MHVFEWLNEGRTTLPLGLAVGVAAAAALLESALGLLLFVPAAAVVMVAAASVDTVGGVLLVFGAAAVARIVGDAGLFGFGRRRGPSFPESALGRRLGASHWDRTSAAIERSGVLAVLLVRLVPVPRALAPAVAGARGVRAGYFVFASIVSAILWSALQVLFGVLIRASFHAAPEYFHVGGAVVVALLVALGIVYLIGRGVVLRRLPDGAVRRVLGDSSVAGMTGHPSGPVTSLRERLFEDEWKTVPNVISAVRILLLPVFGILLVVHQFWAAILTLLVVFLTDFADGFVARRFNQGSALGAWLDPVADRLTVVFVVAAFAASQIVPWQLVLLLLIPDILSGVWAVASFHGAPDVRVSKVGKVRTALLFVGLFMILFGEALPSITGWFVGVGFALFVLGVVGHYLAMTRNARGLVTLWMPRVPGGSGEAPFSGKVTGAA